MPEGLAYGAVVAAPIDLGLPAPVGGEAPRLVLRASEQPLASLPYQVNLPLTHRSGVSLHASDPFGGPAPACRWAVVVDNVAAFAWGRDEVHIDYHAAPATPDDLLAFWLLHLVLPLALSFNGHRHLLHAAGVRIGDAPVLLLAGGKAGKSTLAHCCDRCGDPLLCDDKVALAMGAGAPLVYPSHPFVRPHRGREQIGERALHYVPGARKPAGLVFLERAPAVAAPTLRRLGMREVFVRLQPQYLFSLPDQARLRFEFLAALARDVPGYRLDLPWDKSRLPEVRAALHARFGVDCSPDARETQPA